MARLLKFSVTLVALLVTTAASFAQTGQKNRITQEIDGSQMTRLRGNVHPLLQFGVDQGRVSGATRMGGVSLIFGPSPSQKAALQALIAQQQDPASPNYHKWITPEEYADRFSISANDIAKVTAWLKSQGFTVDEVSRNRNRIFFSGSVARLESVFHTEFHNYVVSGEKHFANATELSVPSAFANTVLGFGNLTDFRVHPRNVYAKEMASVTPRFTQGTQTFLGPDDVATIYDIAPLYPTIDGTGQRIAVVGRTSISVSDIAAFRAGGNLSANPPQLVLVPNSGLAALSANDEIEADLDIEWSGAVARNAAIIYIFVGNAPNFDVFDAWFYAIDNNIAPVISISYGTCEANITPQGFTFLQTEMQVATLQGQAISAAAGDSGATDCELSPSTITTHGLAVDIPAALQEVTGIGGTTFTGDANANPTFWNPSNGIGNGSARSYIPETVWNDSASRGKLASTGGGVSSVITKPAYQTALTPADGHRDVPDLAFSASPDHDGYVVCKHGSCPTSFFAVGGTSVGAPVFAGMLTLINQVTENSIGQGNPNPTLYSLASTPATYTAAFHDITTGNNKQTCLGGSSGCTSANSHTVIAEKHSRFPVYAALFLIPLGAVVVSVGRRRWVAVLGMLLVAAAFSFQIACGGGSGPPPPPPPPPNLSIGWSAGTGYDVVTGLGSVDTFNLATAWPGFTNSPAFGLSASPAAISTTTMLQGTTTITLTRTSGTFSGNVNLTCVATGDATGDPLATCSLSPTLVTLNGAAQTGTTTLAVNASHAGTYLVSVTGKSGNISHSVNVPVTVI